MLTFQALLHDYTHVVGNLACVPCKQAIKHVYAKYKGKTLLALETKYMREAD